MSAASASEFPPEYRLSPEAVRWLAKGERGVSSNTLFTHLTGVDATTGHVSHPHDPADFRRCRLLLERCPELQPRLERIRKVSRVWNALVENWNALCLLMDTEAPRWREPDNGQRASETYALMREIIKENL